MKYVDSLNHFDQLKVYVENLSSIKQDVEHSEIVEKDPLSLCEKIEEIKNEANTGEDTKATEEFNHVKEWLFNFTCLFLPLKH